MDDHKAHRLLRCCATIGVLVLLVGCGGAIASRVSSQTVNEVAPSPAGKAVSIRRIDTTFLRYRILLINERVYTSRDRPIIRAYDIDVPGQIGSLIANVFVYATVGDAIMAKRVDHSRDDMQRANVMVSFTSQASDSARRKITEALNAATTERN